MKVLQSIKEKWYELRTWGSDELSTLIKENPIKACEILYIFKREILLPIIEKHDIQDFLILDEFLGEDRFILLRVNVDEETVKQIKNNIDNIMKQSRFKRYFTDVKYKDWFPEKDANERILGARERAIKSGISFEGVSEIGWKVTGIKGYKFGLGLGECYVSINWAVAPDDIKRKIEVFSLFMTKVVGQFTKAFLSEFPEYIDDRWLLSLFVHLLLNSISMWQENEIRQFPVI